MKRKTLCTLTILLALMTLFISACSPSGAAAGPSASPSDEAQNTMPSDGMSRQTGFRVVADSTGTEVKIPAEANSIAIAPWPWVSSVYTLEGTGKNIMAMTPSAKTGYEISILKSMAPELEDVSTDIISDDFVINMEALAQKKPDLVFTWTTDENQNKQLRELGIPTVALKSANNLGALKDIIEITGKALGREDRTAKILAWYEDTEKYIDFKQAQLQNVERPRVLHFQYASQLKIFANNSMNCVLSDMVGGQNIPLNMSGTQLQMTMEDILKYDPQIIFISNFDNVVPDDFYNNKLPGQDWSKVSAVVNKQVYKVPCGIYRWEPPNAIEKPLYIKWIASIIQPGVFSDVDINKDIQSFLKDFFNYDAAQGEIDTILHKEMYHQGAGT